MASYFDTLYKASWRGANFITVEEEGEFGRKVAVHGYPKRDTVWVEDMGKLPQQFSIQGFLVGDDVLAQRDWMISLCEQPGPGLLIHPTYGAKFVNLLSFRPGTRLINGRMVEISFQFIEAGAQQFPSVIVNTFGTISGAAENLFGAATIDFASKVVDVVGAGTSVIAAGAETVATWSAAGGALTKGASNLFHLSSSITGNFGRYFSGKTGAGGGSISGIFNNVGALATQVNNLIAQGAASRAGVEAAGKVMVGAAATL